MRREPTEAERTLWWRLRSRQLDGLKFRRQVPIGLTIADVLCFEPRLAVECDGAQHSGHAYDAERDAGFAAQGYRVLRFANQTVLQETESVPGALLAASDEESTSKGRFKQLGQFKL